MNGFIKTTVAGLCLGTGITSLVGCYQYRQLVDPCWPERYNAEARLSVRDTFAVQAHNGHVLDQTVWNTYFEADPKSGNPTDRLNAAGMEHLKYIVRRVPTPDPIVFLQTVQDIPGAGTMAPDKLAQVRSEVDNKRVAAIQKYLASVTSGRSQGIAFEVTVHDLAEPGIAALPISGNQKNPVVKGAYPAMMDNFKGVPPYPDSAVGGGGGGGAAPK